jgi:DNA polymerase III epsilon subunit-like protein
MRKKILPKTAVSELNVSYISLTAASEEHPDDKDLQASHANHHGAFQQAEVEHSLLRAPHRAEVPVLTCAEVFLLASEGGDLTGHAEDGLLDAAELFGGCAGFLREICAGLVFDLLVQLLESVLSRFLNECLTEISKSTSLSVKVETELSKQKRYSPE